MLCSRARIRTHQFSHNPHALSLRESPFQQSPPQLSSHKAQMQPRTWVVSHTQFGLTVRCPQADADGARGMDGMDAAGVNDGSVNADGARGMGARCANVD